MRLVPLALLMGCFKPTDAMTPIAFDEVGYDNPFLRHDNVRVRMFDESTMPCPDGQPSRVFAVYQGDSTDSSPAALVLHNGPFDYVIEPDYDGSLLSGVHYQAKGRLGRHWGIAMTWETLGEGTTTVDPTVDSQGTLIAALVDAGFIAILPANCWGDLWHGEAGVQQGEPEEDGFERNGRGFARQTIRYLEDPDIALDAGFEVPVPWNDELYLVGLGDGGRGVAELLLGQDPPTVDGILLDSPRDVLSPLVNDPALWGDEDRGLERIFGADELSHIDTWSILALENAGTLPARTALTWSSRDPQVPNGTLESTAAALTGRFANSAWVFDTGEAVHIGTNADDDLARGAVDYLLTGDAPRL